MRREAGFSLAGFLIVLIVAAFFAYTLMKLVPAYMDYYGLSKAVVKVASDASASGTDLSLGEARRKLDLQELSQYFDDSDIKGDNVQIVNRQGGGKSLQVSYDKQIPWIYNIDFLVHFEKSAPLTPRIQ